MENKPVDSNKVIKKLQDRLGEAITTIALLETKVDDLMMEMSDLYAAMKQKQSEQD